MSKKLLKVLVPLCMIAGVAGLWYMNQEKTPAHTALTQSTDNAMPMARSHNLAYALNASSIDLEALKKLNKPIIIDFGADSCIPCKAMAPVLVKLNAEMQEKAIIKFVDVWKNPDGAKGFPVQVIPTQIIFHADGTPYTPKKVTDIDFSTYSTRDNNTHVFTAHQGGLTEKQMRDILEDLGVQ